MPVIRESNFVVLVNMLMNCLDSPVAFYKVGTLLFAVV
jgi:hypothetical protein